MKLTQTHLWAIAGLFSRIAPVSLIPLLIRIYDHSAVDWFVLIQTNATLISVIFTFSQGNFIQQNYSEETRGSIILFTSVMPVVFFFLATSSIYLFSDDFKTYFYSFLLGLFLSYAPQSQAILRCAGLYSLAVIGDLLRVTIFGIFAGALILFGAVPIEAIVPIMGIYYFLPFLIFWVKVVRTISLGDIPKLWRASVPYLAAVTISVLLSAATLALLRYALLNYGQPGDLAAYAAIYSIASLSAVAVDFIYVRLGQDIVVGARERDYTALTIVAHKIAWPVVVISVISLLVSAIYAAVQFPRAGGDTILAAVIIVASFALRSIYIFYQNILVGLKDGRSNIIASGLALALSGLTAPYLIAWWPLVGAATTLMLISIVYIIMLGSVVRRIRSKH